MKTISITILFFTFMCISLLYAEDNYQTIYYLSDESGTQNIWRAQYFEDGIGNRAQITHYDYEYVRTFDLHENRGEIVYILSDGHEGATRGDLYIIDLDGNNKYKIPNQPDERISTVVNWSPDGSIIVFTLGGAQHYHNLVVATIKPNGSDYQRIIETNEPRGYATHKNTIEWTEKGMYIGDTRQWSAHSTMHEIFLRDNDGNFTNLTNTGNVGERFAYLSPDKQTLVFQTLTNNLDYGISIMPEQGGSQTVVIERKTDYFTWPNGWLDNDRILYTFCPDKGKCDIYTMNIDGSNQINITDDPNIDYRGGILTELSKPNTGTVTDIDGNVYQTVQIGDQWLMAENLRTTRYRNGDAIPTNLTATEWSNTTSGAYAIYPHDDVEGINSDADMVDAYGKLYNWYAVDDERGLCPEGWHVSSDVEWTTLSNYLGGSSIAGGKLKSTRIEPEPHPRWISPNTGATNESGFSGLPGGNRASLGNYESDVGSFGYWWSSTESNSGSVYFRYLRYNGSRMDRVSLGSRKYGFSVRCLKDDSDQIGLFLTSPTGGEHWLIGTTQNITWTSSDIENINIHYSTNNGSTWQPIATFVTASQGSYAWTIPNTPTEQARVRICNAEDQDLCDISGTFSIRTQDANELIVGNLIVRGGNINSIGNNIYEVSGNVTINQILLFDGNITVNMNEQKISGNTLIYLVNVPGIGQVKLYDGNFAFTVQVNSLMGTLLTPEYNLFRMANLPIELDNIELIDDGIRIDGYLIFPEVFGKLKAEVNTIQISHSSGIGLAGSIEIGEVKIHGLVELKSLVLHFDTIKNNFEGSAYLITQAFSINAGALVTEGRLDSVGVWVEIGHPIPLGVTGLSLSGGGGHLAGIANPPMQLALGVSLVPTIQGSFDIVEFNQLMLQYTFGHQFEGSGSLRVFKRDVANVWLQITRSSVGFGGDINFIDILVGEAGAVVALDLRGKINFEGWAIGSLNIPHRDGFIYDFINSIPGIRLPITLARTEGYINNTRVYGKFRILFYGFSYMVWWDGEKLDYDFATGMKLYNQQLFAKQYLEHNIAKASVNRFEGQSLIISRQNMNENMLLQQDQISQFFDLQDEISLMIIRLEGVNETPNYEVVLPDGRVVTKDNVDTFSNMGFFENDEERKSFFAVRNPQLGEWQLIIDGISEYYLDIFGTEPSPAIEMGSLHKSGNNVNVSWDAFVPQENTFLNLYYDTDNHGVNGIMIAQDIEVATGGGEYYWNTDEVPSGIYYVYGVINDGVTNPDISYSRHPVTIIHRDAPQPPTNLHYEIRDTVIKLFWDKPGDGYYYNIYYSTSGDVGYNSSSYTVSDTSSFIFDKFTPGHTYDITVTSIDTFYNESTYSNIIRFTYISTSRNNAPTIINEEFKTRTYPNEEYSFKIEAVDPDDDQLFYELSIAPEGMVIDGNGNISWHPGYEDIGTYHIRVRVSDVHGLADSVSFRCEVLDDMSLLSSVHFDRPVYKTYNDVVIITVTDHKANHRPNIIDTVEVAVYSTSYQEGMMVQAFETIPNSGIFRGLVALDQSNAGLPVVPIEPSDSLIVVYYDNVTSTEHIDISYIDSEITSAPLVDSESPERYRLDYAYPNPFNPQTYIGYSLPRDSDVLVEIYNILGQKIFTLVDEYQEAGEHIASWNGRNDQGNIVSSGVYLYRIVISNQETKFEQTKKVVFLK